MLPKYVYDSTTWNEALPKEIELSFAWFILNIFVFSLWVFKFNCSNLPSSVFKIYLAAKWIPYLVAVTDTFKIKSSQ